MSLGSYMYPNACISKSQGSTLLRESEEGEGEEGGRGEGGRREGEREKGGREGGGRDGGREEGRGGVKEYTV